MTVTLYLSSHDPTEKSSTFHSYVSVSSSEDGVGASTSVECLGDVCECIDEGLHLP